MDDSCQDWKAPDGGAPAHRFADIALACTAIFAFLWIAARAAVQAITIDEAHTYVMFVARADAFHWIPASNNHVLNSMLMRLFVSVFGASHITLRAPALLGAAIYIAAALCLAKAMVRHVLVRGALFVCLVCNPFVQDYLVAARGYSLALGLMLCAIAIPAYAELSGWCGRGVSRRAVCAAASICLALSVAANFSFAVVDVILLALIAGWQCREAGHAGEQEEIAIAAVVPGLIAAIFLCGSVLPGFPKSQLWFGARSVAEMVASVANASVYEVNPNLINPLLYRVFVSAGRVLLPALLALSAMRALVAALDRHRQTHTGAARISAIGLVCAAAVIGAALVQIVMFQALHIPLPLARTALYMAVLPTMVAGSLAALPRRSHLARISGSALAIALCAAAVYFLSCLRLEYFQEWKYDADVKEVYSVLAYYNRAYGVRDVPSNWMYATSLNAYRKLSGHESFDEFVAATSYPAGRPVYVLYELSDRQFIADQKLKVVYHGQLSDVVVAIRPELEGQPAGGVDPRGTPL